ncbi:MAG: hypothetical protein KDE51_23195, partial [Anaerolineales bacterium]|nr:hypothetical protein [Anaerolineales bacterium]
TKKTISIIGLLAIAVLLFGAGVWFGQVRAFSYSEGQTGWMMNGFNNNMINGRSGTMMNSDYGDMMSGNMNGSGMMNGAGMMGMMNNGMMGSMNGQNMSGMMMGQGNMMGNMGMMTGLSGLSTAEPLTINEAETAVTDYIGTLNEDNLILGEIMIFNNHAYAQVLDNETGQGALELLVDPSTGAVFSEPGPNMMWNTQYGMMAGNDSTMMGGMMGNMNDQNMSGMMGNYGYSPDATINITADEAVSIAQEYLDAYLPSKTADDHVKTFPGYYTLHILEDGQTIGMMSVNGYTGQAFLHHWHGDLIQMSEDE